MRRDRYLVRYKEENIKKLDLSTVTKGELGLFAFPAVPAGTPKVDLDGVRLPAEPDAALHE